MDSQSHKKQRNQKPTAKQKKAAKLASENIGLDKPKTKQEILLESGYSQSVAETPELVYEATGFVKALEEAGITDDVLTEVMNGGLKAQRSTKHGTEADHATRHKYLETALRLKGHDKEVKQPIEANVQQNNFFFGDKDELRDQFTEFMKRKVSD